ncbi:MAG: FHA domain-containing protein [Casimicrobiaceae bacterium]
MIWVEVLARHRDVLDRYRCDGPEVTIGRAYDNDVVLDDPYVAAHHVRIVPDEQGRLVAHDLGSVNGLGVEDGPRRDAAVVLDGKLVMRLGRTLVRVRGPDFAVPAERTALPLARTWPAAAGLVGGVAAVSALSLWLSETSEPQLSRYVLPLLAMAIVVLIWTTSWSLMSRIFSGAARFERHLTIALTGLLAFFAFDELTDYGSFAMSWRWLAEFAYVGDWLLFAGLCFFHLREIGPLRLPMKGGVVAAIALAAIGAHTLTKSELSSMFGQQSYLPGLKPPMFRLKAPKSEGEFFADTDLLKAVVDKARRDPVEGPGLLPQVSGDN